MKLFDIVTGPGAQKTDFLHTSEQPPDELNSWQQ